MKKFVLIIIACSNLSFGHQQHVHQYFVREAYKLFKLSIGYDIPILKQWIKFEEGYHGTGPWQAGYIDGGAWREDMEDVVFHLSSNNRPIVTGVGGVILGTPFVTQLISVFTEDPFISSTHFWNPDNGDEIASDLEGTLAGIYFKFTVPNAYQKFMKYVNGGWELNAELILYNFPTNPDGSGGCATQRAIVTFKYNSLIDLYKNKKIYVTKVTWMSGQQTIYNQPIRFWSDYWSSLNSGSYNLFFSTLSFEILGRMCHLLSDMSVPAHTRSDIHGSSNDGIKEDSYENYFGYDYYWDAELVYTNFGGFLNPNTNPLHFLFFTTAQIANYFGSNGPYNGDGNNFIGGNANSQEIQYINSHFSSFLTHIDGIDIRSMRGNDILYTPNIKKYIRDKTFPHTIRATAGLLYWFAKECDLIPPPPPVPPVIQSLSQSPTPLYKGTAGSLLCNLSQGNYINYYWEETTNYPGFTIVNNNSNPAVIRYNSTKLLTEEQIFKLNFATKVVGEKLPTEAPTDAVVKCVVYNSAGRDSTYILVKLSDTYHGCPFVYTWNGQEWIEDNNILPQSQEPELLGQDVTDYYQLYTKPVLEDDKYYLAIGEFEEEKSYLDQLKLLIIDHPDETFVTVDDEGQVIQFAKPAYFASALLDSTDVIKQLYELDNIYVEAAEGDTLYLTFDDVNGAAEPWVLIVGQSHPIFKDKITGKVLGGNKESFTSFRLRRNPTFNWVLVPTTGSSSLDVEIAWEQDAEIDYTELCHELELPFTVYNPQLEIAEHSLLGEVTNQLTTTDEVYVELNKDEFITLTYSAPRIEDGMERTFIFVSRGRYERLSEKLSKPTAIEDEIILPNETKLFDNYPNPFNPTTIINYSLKDAGRVSIKVYDILGSEVATLVNETKPAGTYEVEFNASQLPSGVYIYRMQTGSYMASKKMLLVK